MARAEPAFGPLTEECANHGISRSAAYRLIASGDLATFLVGRRRYVLLDSLKSLPTRMGVAGKPEARR